MQLATSKHCFVLTGPTPKKLGTAALKHWEGPCLPQLLYYWYISLWLSTKSEETGGWHSFSLKNCYIASEEQRSKATTSSVATGSWEKFSFMQMSYSAHWWNNNTCVDSYRKLIYNKKQLPTCPIRGDYVTYVVSVNATDCMRGVRQSASLYQGAWMPLKHQPSQRQVMLKCSGSND